MWLCNIFFNITPGSHHKAELSDKMKSMMFLAQEEIFSQLRQQTETILPSKSINALPNTELEKCADLAEGTQNCLFMLAQQKTSGSHPFKADFPNKSIN